MFSSDPPQSVTPLRRHRKLLKKPEGGAVWPENVERAFLLGTFIPRKLLRIVKIVQQAFVYIVGSSLAPSHGIGARKTSFS
jgi:hypothetical protein